MSEFGPFHLVNYRKPIVTPVFARIRAGGSCAVVGVASMGKSRLLQHILRPEIKQHFLGDESESTLLVWTDCNRLHVISAWGLYELMLTGIVEAVEPEIREPYEQMRDESIVGQNALLAQRKLELALRLLCHEEGMRVIFILDKFDDTYCTLEEQVLGTLRSLRDMNKYQLGYVLFMRDRAEILRAPEGAAIEGFYELFSRDVIGLTPYNAQDSTQVVAQISARRKHELGSLPLDYAQHIIGLSGGHPGLIVALMSHLAETKPTGQTWLDWAIGEPKVTEECRKIWNSLQQQEQQTLSYIAHSVSTAFKDRESLLLKGLIQVAETTNIQIFSPLFDNFIQGATVGIAKGLRVDSTAGIVLINERPIPDGLTSQEYQLVSHMYEHRNELLSIAQIIEALYPGEEVFNITNNSITALVGRIRKKIEHDPKKPQYLVNIKGMGYKLVVQPDEQNVAIDQ